MPAATLLPTMVVPVPTAVPSLDKLPHTQIVFISRREGNPELFLVNATGDNLTRLTHSDESKLNPIWSPDGKWIAFQVNSNEGRQSHIVKIRSDGSELTYLTSGSAFDSGPIWSPDGRALAFTSLIDGAYDIFVMQADGSQKTRLTTSKSGG